MWETDRFIKSTRWWNNRFWILINLVTSNTLVLAKSLSPTTAPRRVVSVQLSYTSHWVEGFLSLYEWTSHSSCTLNSSFSWRNHITSLCELGWCVSSPWSNWASLGIYWIHYLDMVTTAWARSLGPFLCPKDGEWRLHADLELFEVDLSVSVHVKATQYRNQFLSCCHMTHWPQESFKVRLIDVTVRPVIYRFESLLYRIVVGVFQVSFH